MARDHKGDAEFFNKPLVNYGEMLTIFGSTMATRKYAMDSSLVLGTDDVAIEIYDVDDCPPTMDHDERSSATKPKKAKTSGHDDEGLIGAFERVSDKLAAAIAKAGTPDNHIHADLFQNLNSIPGFKRIHISHYYAYLVANPHIVGAFNDFPFENKLDLVAMYVSEKFPNSILREESLAMAKKTVLLYPCPELGHLNPMVELAKALVRRGVSVTLAIADPPDKGAVLAGALARVAAAASSSIGVRLLPIPSSDNKTYSNPVMWIVDAVRRANPALRELLRSSLPAFDALVVDMFCVEAFDIAAELAVPAYMFYPSAAGDLAVYLQVPSVARSAPSSFKDMADTVLNFSGVPPVRALDMPDTMVDRESDVGKTRVHHCSRMPDARGILVNSFDWLEARALKAIRSGLCLPAGRSAPEIYCVGPLVDGGKIGENGERHECLKWLDSQPKQSVVFLCFGSRGTFSVAQLSEMARGIENSGHRFLWAVRSKLNHEVDLEALLPEGFLERTKGRGLVLKNWAPQSEVLQHGAVGAFVTHCGWNSSLEAILFGVPMICWPLYAEQRLNKVHVVEEMKVGVVVEGYDRELVKADELETKVRLVMESEEGMKLRERSSMAKEMAADAIKDGGSSDTAFAEFLNNLGTDNVKSDTESGRYNRA
uniref:Uncharacterized protein n=1 Tax=Leersia perrieri TaxID=77586 RepID=A0A0D9V5C6_9ORYZ